MFQYEFTDARAIRGTGAKQEAFNQWAMEKLPADGLHLKYKAGNTSPFKGKTHEFLATSWGDYVGGDGKPRRFVSYRAAVVNHTIVYTWVWDDDKWQPMTTQSFVQF